MKVGLVSDTHGYFDRGLADLLAGSDIILHAGDVGSEAVLDELRQIAPVHAVRGNVDPPDSGLPLSLRPALEGVSIHVVHILPAAQSDLESWAGSTRQGKPMPKPAERLAGAFDASTAVVLFGHSHQPCLIAMGEILWVNPGSAGRRRFSLPRTCGLLEISARTLRARILPLEDYAGELPGPVSVSRRFRSQP
jgi:uncharacterized protein